MSTNQTVWPWLVVTSGLPSAGKSTYARHLEDCHGFHRISSDDLRLKTWGVVFDKEYQSSELVRAKEYALLQLIQVLKLEQLSLGHDVVIDVQARSGRLRNVLFDTCINQKYSLVARRTLLDIKTSKKVLDERNASRGRAVDRNPKPEPVPGPLFYPLISLRNDNRQQLAQNFEYLENYFS